MQTTTVQAGPEWLQIVTPADTKFVVSFTGGAPVEFAATNADSEPTNPRSHELQPKRDALTSAVISDSYIWVRTVGVLRNRGATLVVTK